MLSEEEKKDIEQAVSNVLSGIDIESSSLILEKVIMDNYIISRGRVNILKIATRQILNFIEEYKNKGYLDIVREKVKANEEITKLQKEIEHQKEKRNNQKAELTILNEKQKEMNKLTNTVSSYKGMFKRQQKDQEKKDKIIDLMAEYLIGVHIDNYDPTWEHEFEKDNFIILRSKEEVKQYFERKSEEWLK